jgi:hypothetical protein
MAMTNNPPQDFCKQLELLEEVPVVCWMAMTNNPSQDFLQAVDERPPFIRNLRIEKRPGLPIRSIFARPRD